jgi:hypothetical protein
MLFAPLERCDLYGVGEQDARARLKDFLTPATKPTRVVFPGGANVPPTPTASRSPSNRPIIPIRVPPKVFISYRRDDSAGHAGRVHDRLKNEFGCDLLFVDVDAIPLGVNFIKVLREEVAKCDVLLALIGPNWLDAATMRASVAWITRRISCASRSRQRYSAIYL